MHGSTELEVPSYCTVYSCSYCEYTHTQTEKCFHTNCMRQEASFLGLYAFIIYVIKHTTTKPTSARNVMPRRSNTGMPRRQEKATLPGRSRHLFGQEKVAKTNDQVILVFQGVCVYANPVVSITSNSSQVGRLRRK